MTKVESLLEQYGSSHQNATNKLIHWICVPLIMFSLLGLLYHIPFPLDGPAIFNWIMVLLVFAWLYYLRLSFSLFAGFVIIGLLMFWGHHKLAGILTFQHYMMTMVGIFVLAWIGQFIGHKIEGKKPSFIKDLQFLLVGPAWLLHFIFERVGIPYK